METKFKETEIGRIPEEWELHQAKRVAFVNMGQSPSSSDCNDEGIGVPFLQGNADFGDKYPKISSWTTNPTKIAKPNDILMSVRAPVGDINLADTECCIGRGLCAITPKSGADLLFLYYILKSSMPRLLRFQQGSTFLAINKQNVDSHLIPLPSLPEQRKIAEILSTVDETIEKTDAIIQETQQLKKGLMQKLFTEGIGHTRFKETKTGRIPEEWEVEKVEEVCHKKINKFEPRESNRIYPYIGLEHIEAHSHILNGYGKSNETLSTKNMFVTNDILYGKLRPYLNKVWKAEFDGVCTTEILVILANDRIEQDYLYYLLQQKRFVEHANSMTEGTSLPRVNWDDIQKYKIALPPKEEQFRIIKILTEVDTKIKTEQAFKSELEQLKKGLMQVLLTGKVRVKV